MSRGGGGAAWTVPRRCLAFPQVANHCTLSANHFTLDGEYSEDAFPAGDPLITLVGE